MTTTLISLISILAGIIGANLSAVFFKKISFGIIGNTIAGVFGSILFIKLFGKLGFDPYSIVKLNTINFNLLTFNLVTSLIGGLIAVVIIYNLKSKLNAE